MKKIIFILCILITSTQAQKRKEKYNIIKSKMEQFDINRFLKNRDNDNHYYFKDEQNRKVEQLWLLSNREYGYEYDEWVYYDETYGIYKNFYANGMIKFKVQYLRNGDMRIYNEHHFNERGELIAKVDTQKGYKFKWDDVVAYCQKNNIDVKKAHFNKYDASGIYFNPNHKLPKLWVISYDGEYEGTKGYITITLDGITGEKIVVEYRNAIDSEGNNTKILYKKEESKLETKKQSQNKKSENKIVYVDEHDDSGDKIVMFIITIFLIAVIVFFLVYYFLHQDEIVVNP